MLASKNITKSFVDCVYTLVIDPETIKSRVTADNIHYLMLLVEELECAALADFIEEIKQEKVKTDIEQLATAIKATGRRNLCTLCRDMCKTEIYAPNFTHKLSWVVYHGVARVIVFSLI